MGSVAASHRSYRLIMGQTAVAMGFGSFSLLRETPGSEGSSRARATLAMDQPMIDLIRPGTTPHAAMRMSWI